MGPHFLSGNNSLLFLIILLNNFFLVLNIYFLLGTWALLGDHEVAGVKPGSTVNKT